MSAPEFYNQTVKQLSELSPKTQVLAMFSTHGTFSSKNTSLGYVLAKKTKLKYRERQDIQRRVAGMFGEVLVFSSRNGRLVPGYAMDGSYQHQVDWKRPGTHTHRDTQGVSAL